MTRRTWKFAYAILMVAAVFCSDSPQDNLVPTGVAVLAFVYLFCRWLATSHTIRRGASSIGLLLFFAAILISFPMALGNGISPRDWLLRGAAPLLFLGVYFLLPLRSDGDIRFVVRCILLACLIWAAKILYQILASDVAALQRWTVITRDLLLPYNLVALSLLLFIRDGGAWRIGGVIVFLGLTVGGGYRSQFLIAGLLLLAYFWRSLWSSRLVAPLFLLAGLCCGMLLFARTDAGGAILGRFLEIGAEASSSRVKEIAFAFDKFLESPLLGNGLAYPIPIEVTFHGREEYLQRIEARESNYSHVTYMHNSVMYLLMSVGLFGLVGYGIFIGSALRGKNRACWWALIAILTFTLAAATITLFQFNLLVGSLAAVLNNSQKRPRHYEDCARVTAQPRSRSNLRKVARNGTTHKPMPPVHS